MDKLKVLVTGGAGYIGSHTCKALAAAGIVPIVVDNLKHGHRDAVKWGPFCEADIQDQHRLEQIFTDHKPGAVLHFAAYAYVGESVSDPEKYYHNNIAGTLSLLSGMRRAGINNIVFSSTCATYGIPEKLPITENTAQNPINPYGYSKLVIERVLQDYGRAYDLHWAVLRYFNAAGCTPDGDLGERHEPETHAIPLAIMAALDGKPEFCVLGTDYPTPDGSAIRDYIHVDDLAAAHVASLRYLMGGGASRAFNLGTGRGTSVLEMIAAVETATNRTVPVKLSPRREGDPAVLVADAMQANITLGWEPKYKNISEIVQAAAKWFINNQGK